MLQYYTPPTLGYHHTPRMRRFRPAFHLLTSVLRRRHSEASTCAAATDVNGEQRGRTQQRRGYMCRTEERRGRNAAAVEIIMKEYTGSGFCMSSHEKLSQQKQPCNTSLYATTCTPLHRRHSRTDNGNKAAREIHRHCAPTFSCAPSMRGPFVAARPFCRCCAALCRY